MGPHHSPGLRAHLRRDFLAAEMCTLCALEIIGDKKRLIFECTELTSRHSLIRTSGLVCLRDMTLCRKLCGKVT